MRFVGGLGDGSLTVEGNTVGVAAPCDSGALVGETICLNN